jgi:hypothetical protein
MAQNAGDKERIEFQLKAAVEAAERLANGLDPQ